MRHHLCHGHGPGGQIDWPCRLANRYVVVYWLFCGTAHFAPIGHERGGGAGEGATLPPGNVTVKRLDDGHTFRGVNVDAVLGVSLTPSTVGLVLVEGREADGATVDHDAFDIRGLAPARTDDICADVVKAVRRAEKSCRRT